MHIWKVTFYAKNKPGLAKRYFYQNINDLHRDLKAWGYRRENDTAPFLFVPTRQDSKYGSAHVESVEVFQEPQSEISEDKQKLPPEGDHHVNR